MTKSKDPFEAAFEEQEQSPAGSPVVPDDNATQIPDVMVPANGQEDDDDYDGDGDGGGDGGGDGEGVDLESTIPSASSAHPVSSGAIASTSKAKEEDDEEEEDNMDAELGKFSSTADPDKMAKMQEILSQFTEDQMSRYESFRRSGFQKPNMKRLLASITGSQKISVPMTIVVSGIAKMFVGELIETARVVMTERNHVGPIRPSHVREAYRRLKVEGKVPKRSVPRLFR